MIDEDGYLFGYINIIDLLVVLVLVSVIAGGVAAVSSFSEDSQTTQVIIFRTTPQPSYVAEALEVGPVQTDTIAGVPEKNPIQTDDGIVLELHVKLYVSMTDDGLPMFKGERLYVGRKLTLDLHPVIVDGVVVDMLPPKTPTG